MYTDINFKTKKALKEAVANGEKIGYYQPGLIWTNEPEYETIFVEGPHYPEPHRWYAACKVKDGYIVKVR